MTYVSKLLSILLSRLHFKPVDIRIRHPAAIEGESLAFFSDIHAVLFPAEVSKRRKKNLECGQALLAIDYLTSRDVCRWCLLLVQDHRTKEVERGVSAAL